MFTLLSRIVLNMAMVRIRIYFNELYEQGASLIITVDNGISGVDEIAYAKSLGTATSS